MPRRTADQYRAVLECCTGRVVPQRRGSAAGGDSGWARPRGAAAQRSFLREIRGGDEVVVADAVAQIRDGGTRRAAGVRVRRPGRPEPPARLRHERRRLGAEPRVARWDRRYLRARRQGLVAATRQALADGRGLPRDGAHLDPGDAPSGRAIGPRRAGVGAARRADPASRDARRARRRAGDPRLDRLERDCAEVRRRGSHRFSGARLARAREGSARPRTPLRREGGPPLGGRVCPNGEPITERSRAVNAAPPMPSWPRATRAARLRCPPGAHASRHVRPIAATPTGHGEKDTHVRLHEGSPARERSRRRRTRR